MKIGFDSARFDLSVIDASHLRRQVKVKWDTRCQDSGNLYFEVENTRRRKPSGVFASEADWWCHVLGDGNRWPRQAALSVRVGTPIEIPQQLEPFAAAVQLRDQARRTIALGLVTTEA